MIPLFTEAEFQAAKSKDMLSLRCLHCTRVFHLHKAEVRRIRHTKREGVRGDFCSISCSLRHVNPPVTVQCLQCRESFQKRPSEIKKSPHHFCGHPCAARYHNAHKSTGTRVSKMEKWIQTRLLELHPTWDFHFNRIDAINSELDIYIPHLRLAFELNGIFHYEPIYGPEKLAAVQNNDERKFQACIEKGIELCLIDTSEVKNFKEAKAQKFLDIIQRIIDKKLVECKGIEPSNGRDRVLAHLPSTMTPQESVNR